MGAEAQGRAQPRSTREWWLWGQGSHTVKTILTKAANLCEAISVEQALYFSHLIIVTIVDVESEA